MKKFKTIITVCRILVGLTFIFSGFVKAVDPVGSMIKFNEYFDAFHTPFLQTFSLFFAITLCSLEFILGFALVFGSRIRLISLLSLLLMVFFTIQTFILALWNPVSDCGCFGDAIKLTNWHTFYKNIILMLLVILVFIYRKKINPLLPKAQWLTIIFAFVVVLTVSLYSYLYKPLIDFRPYKAGNDILKLKTIPKGKHGDIYKSVLIYKNKKTGVLTNFSENNIPMDTNTWQYIDTKTELVEKGYTPPTRDFKIFDLQGNDFTDTFLSQKGYRILIVYENLSKSNLRAQRKINELVNEISKSGQIKVWALTSSLADEIAKYVKKNNVSYSFYTTDPVIIKTIDRSNPAIVLFRDNVVIKHWPARGIPGYLKLSKGIN